MAIVVDANLFVVLVNGDHRGEAVLNKFTDWIEQELTLHALTLTPYEVTNALTRGVVAEVFLKSELAQALEAIAQLPITYHSMRNSARVIEIALSLKRQSAYDAAYLALAEELNAELWTLDGRLYRNAVEKGFNVNLLRT